MLKPLTLNEVAAPLAGRVIGADSRFDGVSIDSRAIQPGQLFVFGFFGHLINLVIFFFAAKESQL